MEEVGFQLRWSGSESALLGFIILFSECRDAHFEEWENGNPKSSAQVHYGRESLIFQVLLWPLLNFMTFVFVIQKEGQEQG